MSARWLPLAGLCALSCIEDLDRKSLVKSPRILDIVADPPEVNPGGSVRLRVVTGGHRETARVRWSVCVNPDPTGLNLGTSGFGAATSEVGCFSDAGMSSRPLGEGTSATLTVPMGTLQNLDLLASRFGMFLQPDTLRLIAREVGLVLGVGVTVEVEGVTLRGYKRVVVSLATARNTNPPRPRLRFGRVALEPDPEDPERCRATGDAEPRARRGETVSLVPDPQGETWFETYRVLTATGGLSERTESAFYSWYATGGSFARDLTRTPTRDNEWVAPDAAGRYDHWVFLRDGRGGTSGCRWSVRVE